METPRDKRPEGGVCPHCKTPCDILRQPIDAIEQLKVYGSGRFSVPSEVPQPRIHVMHSLDCNVMHEQIEATRLGLSPMDNDQAIFLACRQLGIPVMQTARASWHTGIRSNQVLWVTRKTAIAISRHRGAIPPSLPLNTQTQTWALVFSGKESKDELDAALVLLSMGENLELLK